MSSAIYSCSTDGIISEPSMVLERAYAYYLASDYDQTNIYYGNVTSFKKLLSTYSDDHDNLKLEMERSLETYMKNFFSDAIVNVTIAEKNLSTEIEVTDDNGDKHRLSDVSNLENGTINVYKKLVETLYIQ